MTHTKAKLKRMSQAQLIATIMFLLNWMKANDPKAYHAAEKRAGLTAKTKAPSGRKAKGKKRKGRGNPKALMKAIAANGKMSPAAKKKALAKLRKLAK